MFAVLEIVAPGRHFDDPSSVRTPAWSEGLTVICFVLLLGVRDIDTKLFGIGRNDLGLGLFIKP